MKAPLAVLVLSTGCFSAGGGLALNAALGDAPARRVGGQAHVGTFTEIVEDELVGSLFYVRDLGPLEGRANAIPAWGAKISSIGHGFVPGFYVLGAYGKHDDALVRHASTVIAAVGLTFGRMRPGVRGRGYAGISLGLVFHRDRQLTASEDMLGHFVGLELSIETGFDLLGPMFAKSRGND